MITLTKDNIVMGNDQLGTQPKFRINGDWVKLNTFHNTQSHSEELCSAFNMYLGVDSYVKYWQEEYVYKGKVKLGCRSKDFGGEKYYISTFAQVLLNKGYTRVNSFGNLMPNTYDELSSLILDISTLLYGCIGVKDHITNLLWLDVLYFNTDRHLNNIIIGIDIKKKEEIYCYPILTLVMH